MPATCCFAMAFLGTVLTAGMSAGAESLAEQLRKLDSQVIVLGTVRQQPLASMLGRETAAKLRSANQLDRRAWSKVKSRADWEGFRQTRLQALRQSIGSFPPAPKNLKIRITRTLEGDGYRVDNLVYESRPGLVVTANLYRPARAPKVMAGIIVCHSHHQPKHIGARQDMAMTWSRAGCLVLVPDHLGHGERRQHPFPESYPHDYHFRHDAGVQLHLAGASLMGWLAWDLMRGVDVLLAQPEIDPKRILVISEPAGGGDVAAVAAALDDRITGVLVNNFGGPQPETPYPLPGDAEESFAYAGSGSWESTRNLRLSARDGFLPWFIVASIAPRRLIYYHEFYWDREQDPVWKRLQKVYGFYNADDALTGMAGRGFVLGSQPENTHWLPISREMLYPILERWFDIASPKKEYSQRRPPEHLLCLTKDTSTTPLHQLLAKTSQERLRTIRKNMVKLPAAARRQKLRQELQQLLGDIAPYHAPMMKDPLSPRQRLGHVQVERIHLGTEAGTVVPVLLLVPPTNDDKKAPVVVCLAQAGKKVFLHKQADAIAELLSAGVAVCLPDVRGTGETSPGDERDRRSAATSISAGEWMIGQSLLGGRLRDIRSLLSHLRQRPDLDATRVALWGDSFAPVNPPDVNWRVPHNASKRPAQSEPLGALLAMLVALFEDDVRAVHVQGGLSDFHSVLAHSFVYLPHDIIIPNILHIGDLPDLAAVLAPRSLQVRGLVDGLNRLVPEEALSKIYAPATSAYAAAEAQDRLKLEFRSDKSASPAPWLIQQLRRR